MGNCFQTFNNKQYRTVILRKHKLLRWPICCDYLEIVSGLWHHQVEPKQSMGPL